MVICAETELYYVTLAAQGVPGITSRPGNGTST